MGLELAINGLLLISLIVYKHPVTATPESEAKSASGSCKPHKCVYTEWTFWTTCSRDCGKDGTRHRTRRMLGDNGCGGSCREPLEQTEPCNVRCCPQNCVYSEWNAWYHCRCSTEQCEKIGNRYVCLRSRSKVKQESCGGYCDDVLFEERCGNPCCYRDCVMGAWAAWSQCQAPCEQPGVKYRNRTVLQEPKCGGARCEYESDQRHCMGSCCPVHCVQGPWSAWSLCPASCGNATVHRTRFVQQASCGGRQCQDNSAEQTRECQQYNNVDCKVSPWSVWSQCQLHNGRCGEGTRKRHRSVLVAAECHGAKCPPLEEQAACQGHCCVTDCVVSDWSKFGHCSTSCGQGKRNSTRQVLVEPICGGQPCPDLVRFRPCTMQNKIDCQLSSWAPWSPCDNRCGKGRQRRSRTLLTPAYCGGKCVSMQTQDSRSCESYSARADCKVGEWGAWSQCVRDCDRGLSTRTRVIVTNDACGGIPCTNYNLTERRTCHAKCSQLCNQARCSCRPGFLLQKDGVSCKRRTCGHPSVKYCGPGTVPLKSCFYVDLHCNNGTEFESRCVATCSKGWVVKGGEPFVTCLATGRWSSPKIFCGPRNKPPLNISVNTVEVSERLKAGQCFAELTTTTDDEPWDKHTYRIVQDGSGNLQVQDDHLCCIRPFDFERTALTKWQTTVRSTDLDGLSVDREFTFTLLNENDPPRSVTLSPDTVPENSRAGTVVGCLQGHDDDPGQVLAFFIVKSTDKLFELFQDQDNNTCVRVSKDSDPRCYTEGGTWCRLNFEVTSRYYMAVMVQDNGSPPLASYFDVQIAVQDVNEPITGVSLQPPAIPEGVRPGQPLVELVAKDEDKKQNHTFRILSDASGLFSTDGNHLVASKTFDYEEDPNMQFILRVEVTDDGTPPMKTEKELTLGVADKNESPHSLMVIGSDSSDMGKLVLRENMPDTLIGTVSVHDPDAGDSVALTVSNPGFSLQNKRCSPLKDNMYNYCSAQLVATKPVDFETTPSLTLTIVAKDDNFHRVQKEFTVRVLDQNDPPTDILVNGRNASVMDVREKQPATRVGVIRVVDEDRNDTHSIFLSGSASSQFRVDNSELFTTSTSSLNYERRVPLSLVMTAIDGGRPGQTVVKTFTINITDINEQPTDISLSNTQVVENSPAGTLVGTFTTLDPDNEVVPRQNFTYTLLDDANGRFRVQGDQLVVSQRAVDCFSARCSLNHELQPHLLLRVRATDSGLPPLSLVTPLILSVTDANDAPSNIRLSKNTVRENEPNGTLVGTIMADDEDAMNTMTFTLVNGSDVFAIEHGDRLVTARSVNYENIRSLVLAVRATDNGQPPASTEAVVTVVIEDVAEPPVFHTPAVMSVVENEPAGSIVGAVVVTDPDLGDHLDIIMHEPTESFTLAKPDCTSNGSGMTCNVTLKTAVVLEFEAQTKYELDVSARDSQGHAVVRMITVSVMDTNDPPSDLLVNGMSVREIRVEEGMTDQVWELRVVEQDKGQNHSLAITYQARPHLTLQGTTLKVTKAYDYETEAESLVMIKVTDSGTPPRSLVKAIKVIVEDANEVPVGLTISNHKVAENSKGGTLIGQLRGRDPDLGQTLTYTLQDDAGQRFLIDGDRLVVRDHGACGGEAQLPCRLNFEAAATHKVTVMVTDNGSPRKHATFDLKIEVTDANDPPHDMHLSANTVAEVAAAGTEVGKLTVLDEDKGQSHSFKLLDDAGGKFRVTAEGVLVKATGDRLLVQQVLSVKVKATDNGTPPAEDEKTFYLSISGVSEAPGVPSLSPRGSALLPAQDTLKIPENTTVNATVAMVTSVDNDPQSALTFILVKDGDGHFVLGEKSQCTKKGGGTSCTSRLALRSPVDYESRLAYQLLLRVTDPKGLQATLPFTVHVTNVNEQPQSVAFVTGEIEAEEGVGGLPLGTFSVLDPDDGDTHTYSLTQDHGAKFSLSASGLLATAPGPGLDYEKEHVHPISVQVRDSAGNVLTQEFNVTVLNVNEKPLSLALVPNNTIREMSAAESVIGRLAVKDPDNEGIDGVVQHFTFSLLSDNEGRFKVEDGALKVKDIGTSCTLIGGAACLLDYESKTSHQVILAVTDSGTPPITQTLLVQVHVLDANDQPTPPVLDTLSVAESMVSGSVIGRLSSMDQDQGQTLHYDLVGESAAFFAVSHSHLLLAHTLDHELAKEVKVTIRVTDDGQPPLSNEETITISVENVNEAPADMAMVAKPGDAGVDFPSNQPIVMEDRKLGSVVAQLVVSDPDLQEEMTVLVSDAVIGVGSMSCLSLTRGSRCVGDVTLGRVLNYEERMTWAVDVTAVDGGGLKIKKTFNISVGDTNDPPVDLLINGTAVNNISVPENSQAVTLATLSAVDPDRKQRHSFSVVGSTFFYIAGNKLLVTPAASLNYEDVNTYTVQVKVTDTGSPPLSFTKDVTISIVDVNEAPTDVTLSMNKVREHSAKGTVVGQLLTTDPDNARSLHQTHTYSLTDDAAGRFAVTGDNVVVKEARLDYETAQSHSIIVEVTDSGHPPLKAQFTLTIDVLDTNDPPTNLRLNVSSIPENTGVGRVVGELEADDVDRGQTLRFAILSNPRFVVSGSKVVVDGSLDYETTPLELLDVRVTDTGSPPLSLNKTFKVHITDVNEVPGVVNLTSLMSHKALEIPESAKVGDVIALLTTFDPDTVDFVTMNMTSRSDPRLKLEGRGVMCKQQRQNGALGTMCSVHVQLVRQLNYEDNQDLVRLEVETRDKGGLGRREGWTFTVADTNDRPTAIRMAGNRTEIPENEDNYVLGTLQCFDPDPGDTHTFQLLTQWRVFRLTPGGLLTVARPLNYEWQRHYDVMVRCEDSGGPPLSVTRTFTFSVKNLNEKPSDIYLSHAEVSMTAAKDSIVGFLLVSDPDNEGSVERRQHHVCQLDSHQDVFYIDGNRNTLRVKNQIPANKHNVPITITCTDDAQPPLSITKHFTVLVVETADVPKQVRLTGTHKVKENQPPTVLGELTVVNLLTDRPVPGNYTCANLTVKETKERVLAIEGNSLVTKQQLDFETLPYLIVTLTCTGLDMKGHNVTVTGEITVDVVDVNEAPTEIRVYGGGQVEENSGVGTVIARLNTVDPEPDQNYTYSVLNVARGIDPGKADPALLDVFQVQGRDLMVGPKAMLLNYEDTPIFSLTLQSTDDGHPPLSVNGTVIVEVKDVNEPPTNISIDNNQVSEDSVVDTVVGHILVTDEDRNQTHRCHVINLSTVPFNIKNGSSLVVSGDLDYETTRTYVVEVSCQDDGADGSHLRVTAPLTVNVTDVNEAPYDVRLSRESVAENSGAGQVVGEILATDPDSQQVRFSIEKGREHFAIEGDNTLTATSSFNYEHVTSLPVTIRATDNQGLSTVRDFLIQIEDKNDPPTTLSMSSHVVQENTPPGHVVSQMMTEDPDRGQTFTYVIAPDPAVDGHLAVSGDKLVVGKRGIDYERSDSYRVKVTATDSGVPPLNITKDLKITVINVNEPPTEIVTHRLSPVLENVTVPHTLTSVSVTDPDTDQRHSCHLTGSPGPLSVITSQDGKMALVLIGRLDYETAPSYDVTLICTDGMLNVTKKLHVQVLDVNEPPTQLTLRGPQAVPASVDRGQQLGLLIVTDQDRGQTHTLVITGPDSDLLTVRSGNRLVLTKALPAHVLLSPTPEVTFTVTATDNGRPPLSLRKTLTLPVTKVKLQDLVLPTITLTNGRVREDAKKGTEVGALYNLNTTLSDTVHFRLLQDVENLFEIKDNRMLVLSRNMSTFRGHSAQVTLQAWNSRTGETTQRTITVLVMRSDKCLKDGRSCDENARCVALSDQLSQCRCAEDFRGDGYTCEQINHCLQKDGSSPCQHGKCVDAVNDFRCVCPEGYNGRLCEVDRRHTDPCIPNPCSNGGACLLTPGNATFSCTCTAGWQGDRCTHSVDDCVTGRCHGANSTCVDRHLTFLCTCSHERRGPRCEYLKAACPAGTCENEEVCTPTPDSVRHTCVPPGHDVTFLIRCGTAGIADLKICHLRFLDFVRAHGRFPEHTKVSPDRKRQHVPSRVKRASALTGGTQYTPGVHVYRKEWKAAGKGKVRVTLVVLDVQDAALTRREVLDSLHQTCTSIKSGGMKQSPFCPAIEEAHRQLTADSRPEGEGEDGGVPVAVIAGAVGGAVLLIVLIIVVVIVIKRRKKDVDSDSDSLQIADPPTPALETRHNPLMADTPHSPSSATFTSQGSKVTNRYRKNKERCDDVIGLQPLD